MQIVLATRNLGKLFDFNEMKRVYLGDNKILDFWTLDMFDEIEPVKDVVEDGKTFSENARKKAQEISLQLKGVYVLADDSGLCIDTLNGAPGVYSARYAGDHDDEKNITKVLSEMSGKHNRKCHYECVLCLAKDGKVVREWTGKEYGTLAKQSSGTGGFGYDPIFIPNDVINKASKFKRTKAELKAFTDRMLYSHRTEAFREFVKYINRYHRNKL